MLVLLISILFSYILNIEQNGTVNDEMKKIRENNNKKFNEILKEYLKEMNLDNKKYITREEFKNIFIKLYEFGGKELNNKIKNENKYIEKIFDNLVNYDVKEIEVDKIINYFEPQNMLNGLKGTLNLLGIKDSIKNLEKTLSEKIDNLIEKENIPKNDKIDKNSDL